MSNIRSIVRKTLLNEVAGISFEVRKWAQIIEQEVKEKIKVEREKLKSQQPKWEPIKTSAPLPPVEREVDLSLGFTHFEYVDNEDNITDTAYIYFDELTISGDVLDYCPGIERSLSGVLLKVELLGNGDFIVSSARGSSRIPQEYIECVTEMVEDHAVMDQSFYDIQGRTLYASQTEDLDDFDYDFYNRSERSYSQSWGGYGGWIPTPKIEKIVIEGKNYPEAYEDFKVDRWIITNSNRIEYDHWKSGYNDDGEYEVYLNMSMSSVGGSALVHEIKHAYDDWNRISKGYPPIRDSWEVKNIYTKDFEKLVLGGSFKLSPMLHPIIRYYYLGSKLEAPAYLENEYDYSSYAGSYRDTAKKLMNFKASNFLTKKGYPAKGLQESWTKLITDYDIPLFRKFPNVVDFLKYTEKYFNKRGRDILRRIDKMRYVHDRIPKTPSYVKPKKYDGKKDDLPF